MNEQRIDELMMNALDGEISAEESAELHNYLANHPALSAEWSVMLQIEAILCDTAPISVPVHFAQRTMARLPNPNYRRFMGAIFYIVMVIAGSLPILLAIWLVSQLGFVNTWQLGQQFSNALQLLTSNLLTSLGSTTIQPALLGSSLFIAGLIGLWVTVYRRMTTYQLIR